MANINYDDINLVNSNKLKNFYCHVNKLIKCRTEVSPLKAAPGELLFDNVEKASLLNNYFASVSATDNGALLSFLHLVVNFSAVLNLHRIMLLRQLLSLTL